MYSIIYKACEAFLTKRAKQNWQHWDPRKEEISVANFSEKNCPNKRPKVIYFEQNQKKNKKTLFLFQACHTHASYNSDPGHRYKLRVIQVNRLTQVFNSQRTGSAEQNSNASYRDSWVKLVPYIAIDSVATGQRPSVVGSRVKLLSHHDLQLEYSHKDPLTTAFPYHNLIIGLQLIEVHGASHQMFLKAKPQYLSSFIVE